MKVTRSVSEGGKARPRLRFGLLCRAEHIPFRPVWSISQFRLGRGMGKAEYGSELKQRRIGTAKNSGSEQPGIYKVISQSLSPFAVALIRCLFSGISHLQKLSRFLE
jgi:hypothetical protein